MIHDVSCTISLNLSLGDHDFPRNHLLDHHDQDQYLRAQLGKKFVSKLDLSRPALTLGLCQDQENGSSISAVSSFSNSTSSKRERDCGSEEVLEKVFLKAINHNDQGELDGGSRKKLRLTKEQSFVLEESFKEHSILFPKQKQTLAKCLNLPPRQVEVWFQNRRARTKLKQNEVDCALLKKCHKALTSDNRRLKMEIQQLKATKTTAGALPYYTQFPTTTHIVCPFCERIVSDKGRQ